MFFYINMLGVVEFKKKHSLCCMCRVGFWEGFGIKWVVSGCTGLKLTTLGIVESGDEIAHTVVYGASTEPSQE